MKVVQINAIYGAKSTGVIMKDIHAHDICPSSVMSFSTQCRIQSPSRKPAAPARRP